MADLNDLPDPIAYLIDADTERFGLQFLDRGRHVLSQAGAGAGFQAGQLPGRGDVLAGETGIERNGGLDGVPVDGGDVSEFGLSAQW